MKTQTRIVLFAFALAGAAGIAGAAEAADNWKAQCAKCHGLDGSANTAIGKKLKLKNYTDASVQAEMKDEEMVTAIKTGTKDSAGKQAMPAYAEKLSETEIDALVAYVRAMKKG
jgi:mono/diheme cytochrome c family protein